jgi:hypothetical protein
LEVGNEVFSAKRMPSDKKKPLRCGARNCIPFSQFTRLRSIENSLREAAKGSPSGRMLVVNKNLDITLQLLKNWVFSQEVHCSVPGYGQ